MHFASLFALSSFVIASLAIPLTVISDITALTTGLNGITTSVASLPDNPNLTQVGSIHKEVITLGTQVEKSTQSVAGQATFSKKDSADNLAACKILVAAAQKTLDTLVAHKASFKNTAGGDSLPIVIADLVSLADKAKAWAKTMTAHADPSDVPTAHALEMTLNDKFTADLAFLKA